MRIFVMIVICLLWMAACGEQHIFRVPPQDTYVRLGRTATLQCEINGTGSIHWRKDGVVLGFSRNLPGLKRYSIVGNETLGTHNLQIENTTFHDGAVYECRVEPEKAAASAHLVILGPPNEIHITGPSAASIGDVITLQCSASVSHPPVLLSWFNNYNKQVQHYSTRTVTAPGGGWLTMSNITIEIMKDDRDLTFTCQAEYQMLRLLKFTHHTVSIIPKPLLLDLSGINHNVEGRDSTTVRLAEQEQIDTSTDATEFATTDPSVSTENLVDVESFDEHVSCIQTDDITPSCNYEKISSSDADNQPTQQSKMIITLCTVLIPILLLIDFFV